MMTEHDWQAFTRSLDLSGEPSFPPEVLAQHDYSDKEWDVDYKETHIWSFDTTLAIFLDKGLTGIMAFPYSAPEDGIERARDIFRAYATKDDGPFDKDNPFPFEIIGSPEHNDLMWALDWLKERFTALWT
jgi:hypothetical protein